MSQENVEIVRVAGLPLQGVDMAPFIRASLEGDTGAIPSEVAAGIAAWVDMLDRDLEIDTSRVDMPGFDVLRGPEANRELWRRWIEEWERYSWTHSNWTDVGDHVMADVRIRATGKSSGVDVVWDHCQMWTIRDGKVVRWLFAKDRASALEAVGLSAQDAHADA
jgi:ketosteroid isomerase-like protein